MNNLIYEKAFASEEQVVTVGKLNLPSGKVVACDPYFCANAVPFSWTVPPGTYEVELCIINSQEWGQRIALARILVKPGRVVAFERAVKEFTDSNDYFVDSGTGSFIDELTCQALADVFTKYYRSNPQGNYYTDVLAAEFKMSAINPQDPNDIGKWNLHYLPDSASNVAMFASGLGDGFFGSFWGVDEDGEILSLVTDFKIL
jgi:Protein of unknown function (DUF4241)